MLSHDGEFDTIAYPVSFENFQNAQENIGIKRNDTD